MTEPVGAGGRRRGMRILALLPLCLLIVQAVWVHHDLEEAGRLEPIRVADSESYQRAARLSTIDGVLSHYRTYGYPLLLKSFGWRGLVPVELLLYLAASIAFFAGVWAYSGSAWVGLAAASPLLYGEALDLLGRIQPDFVACAFVLFSVAALLGLVTRPRNALLWSILAIAVFAGYQTRPATLFTILWLPASGWALQAFRDRTWRRPRWGWLAGLVVATVLPYLLFAGWRASRIGEFGLVAFGGYNMSGLAASLIDDAMLEELDGDHQVLARKILRRRSKRGWEPYDPRQGSLPWFEQYSENMWRISVQVAKGQLVTSGALRRRGDPDHPGVHVRVNRLLRDFSRDIIRRRPRKYLSWVRDANLYGWRQLPGSPWTVWPAAILLVSAAVWWVGRRRQVLPAAATIAPRLSIAAGLLVLGLGFFTAYILLISLLSFPFIRYFDGACLLLPSALCGALAALWLGVDQRSMTASTSGERTGGAEA